MEMERQLAVVADDSEVAEKTDVLNIGSIDISDDGVTFTSLKPGVVCTFHASTDGAGPVITVGLDKSIWHEISPGISVDAGKNEQPSAENPPYGYCQACGCRRQGRTSDPRLCLSCRDTLAREAHIKVMASPCEAQD